MSIENDLRAQLAYAVGALNEVVKASAMHERPFEIATLAIGELSASAELSAPVERDERAGFEKWYAEYTAQGFMVSKFGTFAAWQARAALDKAEGASHE